MIGDGKRPNSASLLGNAGRAKGPLQALPGAHPSLDHPFLAHGHTQPDSSQLEQEQCGGASHEPGARRATGLPSLLPPHGLKHDAALGNERGRKGPRAQLLQDSKPETHISKSWGTCLKCRFLGRTPGHRITLPGDRALLSVFSKATPAILVHGQGWGSGPTLSFYK